MKTSKKTRRFESVDDVLDNYFKDFKYRKERVEEHNPREEGKELAVSIVGGMKIQIPTKQNKG